MLDTTNDAVKFLMSLRHARRTDLSRGLINNQDAILILLYALGPFGGKTLKEFSLMWKGHYALQPYFGPHYGYTGKGPMGRELFTGYFGPGSGAPKHPPYWYRMPAVAGKPFVNCISLFGMNRLVEIGFLPA